MMQNTARWAARCAIGAILAGAGSVHAQNQLLNPSFETVGGGAPGNRFAGWTDFDNCFVQELDPRTGLRCAKAYGNNSGPYNASGIYQEFTVTPGSAWRASVYVRNRSDDPIQGLNFAALNVEWYDGSNTLIMTDTTTVANAATPTDQWFNKEATFVAPPGAAKARYVLLHLQESTAAGSVQWDDASVLPVAVVTNQLQNSSFEILGSGSPHDKFANWFDFDNCFVQPQRGHFGGTSAKAFGNWSGPYNASGLYQEVAAAAGQQWTASVFVYNDSADAIAGLNFAAMNIEWFNAANTQISYDTLIVADASTPRDQWIRRETTFTAPAGTAKARYVLLHLQAATDPGSVLFDDAALGLAPVACYANCDGSTVVPTLNINDFVCFQQKFAAGDPYANCDASTSTPTLNINDFTCFLNKYAAGCP